MSDIFNDPTVKFMFIALLLAVGGYLTALFRRLSKKLDYIADGTQLLKNDVKEVAKTTTETVTLVDGQLSDVKAQLKDMMGRWEGTLGDLAKEKEEAVQVSAKALQTLKEQATQERTTANEQIANLTHQLKERIPNHAPVPEPARTETLVAIIPESTAPVVAASAPVPRPKRPPRVRRKS